MWACACFFRLLATRSKVGRKVTVGGIRSFKPEKASCAAQGLAWLAGLLKQESSRKYPNSSFKFGGLFNVTHEKVNLLAGGPKFCLEQY